MTAPLRYSVNIPNFGDFADARTVAQVARPPRTPVGTACSSGTTWCTTSAPRHGQPFGDPWILLTAAALATTPLRLGPLVTPVPRRRPENLARQVATLDALSGGRVIFGAGLGAPLERVHQLRRRRRPRHPRRTAGRRPRTAGPLLVRPAGRPRRGALHGPRRHAAAGHGAATTTAGVDRRLLAAQGADASRGAVGRRGTAVLSARHGRRRRWTRSRALAEFCHAQRDGAPFDVVVGGRTDPRAAAEVVGPLAAAGATWWDERQYPDGPELTSLTAVLRRVEAGPPQF